MKSWSRRALEIAGDSIRNGEESDDSSDEEMPALVPDEWRDDFDKLETGAYKIVMERCAAVCRPCVQST